MRILSKYNYMYVVVLSFLFHPVMTNNMCIKPGNDYENGKKLPVSHFMVLSKIGLQMCLKQCETYAMCLSINFNRRMLICELNSQNKNESLLLVDDADFIYKDLPGVFDYRDKKCGNVSCDHFSQCIQTKFNTSVCIAKDMCEEGWHQFGDSCYQFSASSLSFNDAVKMCNNVSNGTRLLEIRSAEEENWIRLQMEKQGLTSSWMGITDSLAEGTYLFLSTGSSIQNVYSNWANGQPGGGTGENCELLLLNNIGWHDYPCNNYYKYICKKARF